MQKDPAALVYISNFISATNGMKAAFRAWYFDLILYQFDKGEIPSDVDELAGICRVRPSEYELFNQMVNQVINQKFNQKDNGCLENSTAASIISQRSDFKKKRTKSSNIGVIIKKAKKISGVDNTVLSKLSEHLNSLSLEEIIELKEETKLNQLVNRLVNLYIDINIDINNNIYKGGMGGNMAYKFLKEKSASAMESFEMQNKKLFGDRWETFLVNYEANVVKNEIPYDPKKLYAELMRLKANWNFSNRIKNSNSQKTEIRAKDINR